MKQPSRQYGFTLIELVVALALSAMLMVALLGVIQSTVQAQGQERRERDASPSRLSLGLVTDLLRHDLVHATAFNSEDNTLRITAISGIDPTTRRPTHRPVTIVYERIPLDGRIWLVRTQVEQDNPTNQASDRAMLLSGVTSFEVLTPGTDEPSVQQSSDRVRTRIDGPNSLPWVDQTLLLTTPVSRGGTF